MLILQSTSYSVVARLVDSNGSPLSSLTIADVTASLKKATDSSFSTFTLVTNTNFINNGNGYYTIVLTTGQTNVLGSLYLLLRGQLFQDAIVGLTVISTATTVTPSPSINLNKTVLFGSIVDSAGNPLVGASVGVTLLGSPAIVSAASVGVGVSNAQLAAKTDSQGYFTISVVTNLSYEVFIPSINFRRSITVTNSTPVNVFGA